MLAKGPRSSAPRGAFDRMPFPSDRATAQPQASFFPKPLAPMSLAREYRVFWREFRNQYQTTGSITPSSISLARALARFVGQAQRPCRILEVGPGTGAITRAIVAAMRPADRLDLVELNDRFVAELRRRFQEDPLFAAAASQARVLHQRVESLEESGAYDVIVSGLPLNNFAAEDVRSILSALQRLAAPGGTLSFFEYIAVRRAKRLVSPRSRDRLQAIGAQLAELKERHGVGSQAVFWNFPPAWAHHVRFD
jgi:phosphatidylethanolamine/phosphatidyl-N-methylethanolamine N-methyltransferase